jgi:hypothetical protein
MDRLERFPVTWNHVTDKKSLQINKLEHVLIKKVIQLFLEHALSQAISVFQA